MFIATRSRRVALAAAVVISLSACGSSTDVTSSSGDAGEAAGTTIVAAQKPPVIQVAEGWTASPTTGAAASAERAVSADSSKMMMAAFYDYVYGGDDVDLTAPAASWSFAPGVTPAPEQILRIASALGVEGDVRNVPAEMGGGWAVGSDDYSEPSINVGPDATLGWWFNAGYDESVSAPSCAVGEAADAASTTEPELIGGDAVAPDPDAPADSGAIEPTTSLAVDPALCGSPEPPAGVPTADDATAKANELFTAFGLDPADFEIETFADDWSASVTGFLLLDGMRTPMSISFGFGAEGALTWAGGFLATPIRNADYPRIGVEAAVQRLNDQSARWSGGVSPTVRAEQVPVDDTSVSAVDAVPVSEATVATVATDKEVAEGPTNTLTPPEFQPDTVPASVDMPFVPVPETTLPIEIERVTVTLETPRPSIEMLWAADGTVWLLPGYAFDSPDQGTFTVLAVGDEFIQVTENAVDAPVVTPMTAPPVTTTALPQTTPVPPETMPVPPETTTAITAG